MRKIFEELIFVGRIEKEFDLYGHTWLFATLTTEEQVEATTSTGSISDQISRINAIKIQLLSKAIKSVDGHKLLDTNEAFEILNKMQFEVINGLFLKYEQIQQEQDVALKSLDEIKN